MIFAVCFTNFGPYHLARLRALAARLRAAGDRPDRLRGGRQRADLPVGSPAAGRAVRLDHPVPRPRPRDPQPGRLRRAIARALDRDQPDAVGIVGYARPESMAAARWAGGNGRPAILMSESQAIDRPRTWWKEMIKAPPGPPVRRRPGRRPAPSRLSGRARDAGRSHRPGLQRGRQRLLPGPGRRAGGPAPTGRAGLPAAPVLPLGLPLRPREEPDPADRGLRALSRAVATRTGAWDLVLCGDGPEAAAIEAAIATSGHAEAIHRPGFLQADALPRLVCPRRRPSCSPASRSRGAWSSTRPPRAACRCWSRTGPAARRRWFPSRRGRPAPGSIHSTSRR